MANTDTIQPALAPDEWDAVRDSGGANEAWPHRTMALANATLPDDDPRKITREMVKAMATVYAVAYASREYVDREVFGLASNLITALAALLPPE